jgi:hypothetical protein
MKNSVLTVTHYKVTFSENCNGGSNKPQVDPKKALAQLFIDVETMITQPGPIMEKVFNKNVN